MRGDALPCALEGVVTGVHGPGLYSHELGAICVHCFRGRQSRGMEDVPNAAPSTFTGVPLNMRTALLYKTTHSSGLTGRMHIKRKRRAPVVREPYVELRETDLHRLLPRLAPEQREVIELQQAGHSYVEISELLHVGLSTVRERLRRARAHLRELRAR